MDPKRELTSVDLAALVGELRRYRGAKLDKAYLYEDDDLVRLKLRDFEEGRVELLVQVGENLRAHVVSPEHVPDAPGRPPNFAKMMRNRLSGADLVAVEQYEFDRILTFRFERGDGATTVVAELFGDGNVAVLDEHGDVVDCLRTVRLKSRTVAPGAPYEFPDARFDPLSVDFETFLERMEASDADVVRTLATRLNFGGLYGEELCTRAGLPYNQAIGDTTEDEFSTLYAEVERLGTQLREGSLDPGVYRESGDDGDPPVDVTPVALREYEHLDREGFETFTAALEAYFTELEAAATGSVGGEERPDFEAEIEKHRRIIDQQESAIADFESEAQALREEAELLYAHYDLVDEVLSTVREARADDVSWAAVEETLESGKEAGIPAAEAVRDVDGSEGTVTLAIDGTTVALDVDTGVEKNADRLYTEAKRVEDKKEGAQSAIEETRAALEGIERRREEWESGGDDSAPEPAASTADEEPVDWLGQPSIPVRQTEQWYERFRWFHTSEDFLVIGGRDADQNEELVKKYLDPGDTFLHADAHGGPVTVLKATGPSEPTRDVDVPESSVSEAATFAVSYSSVWKAGRYAGDVYAVDPEQVSKTPESGEYLEKGGFAVRGERTYFRGRDVDVSVGITCEDETRVIGGPTPAIASRAETSVRVEPGRYARSDVAKKIYRTFRERFADESFVRKVASPDLIGEFLPPGTSRIVE